MTVALSVPAIGEIFFVTETVEIVNIEEMERKLTSTKCHYSVKIAHARALNAGLIRPQLLKMCQLITRSSLALLLIK